MSDRINQMLMVQKEGLELFKKKIKIMVIPLQNMVQLVF
jgi:hypothetical protein